MKWTLAIDMSSDIPQGILRTEQGDEHKARLWDIYNVIVGQGIELAGDDVTQVAMHQLLSIYVPATTYSRGALKKECADYTNVALKEGFDAIADGLLAARRKP